MKKRISLLTAILFLILSSASAQRKKCKYLTDEIDDFTKKKNILTEYNEIYAKVENSSMGIARFEFNVAACNYDGVRYIKFNNLFYNHPENDMFEEISLLLENDEVITFTLAPNKYPDWIPYLNEGNYYTESYKTDHATWAKLKSTPLKKVRISYAGIKRVKTIEVKGKNSTSIMRAIECIDGL